MVKGKNNSSKILSSKQYEIFMKENQEYVGFTEGKTDFYI